MIAYRFHIGLAIIFAAGSVGACQPAPPPAAPPPAPAAAATPRPAPSVVEITAVDYAFQAPEVIPSGWTTIRFRNEGEEHHMIFLARLPEGQTFESYVAELEVPFSRAWYAIRDRELDQEQALARMFQELPAWFGDLDFPGGSGIAAPGVTTEVTLNLQPGTYVMECYIKTPEGEVHYMEGMARAITVSPRPSGARPPQPDIQVTLSNFDMEVRGNLTPGRRTVAVHVAENPEQGFGHSVHVARVEPGTDPKKVVQWMNWFALDGLRTPAPAHFVGGMHPLPEGQTAYFTANLEPGRYLFVSEATGAQGVRREVTVR